MDPSWHHNYASLAWIGGDGEAQHEAHYPSIKPELVELTSALHGLAHDAEMRAQYIADAGAFADRFHLPPDQREALVKLDLPSIVEDGRASARPIPGANANSAPAPATLKRNGRTGGTMSDALPLSEQSIAARLERLPYSGWHVTITIVLGVAIFFDSFDSLAIAYVLPVLIRDWHIPPEVSAASSALRISARRSAP